jgi:hypothetical protein
METMTALTLALAQAAGSPSSLQPEDETQELAKSLSNPFADVITIPVNQNPDFGIGDDEGWLWRLTVQPVVPIRLGEEWNIISRSILPVIYQEVGDHTDFGLGDATQTFYLSPLYPTSGGWFWGVGPILVLPTATEDRLGVDQWAAGPAVGLLRQSGPWTAGALANHTWWIAGEDDSGKQKATFLQPFLDYTLESGTTLSLNTESTYDWTRDQWTAPVHFVVRQLLALGDYRVSVALGVRYYVNSPDGGPEWGLRLGVTIVLPK